MDWITRLHVQRLLKRLLAVELTVDEAIDALEDVLERKGVTPLPVPPDQLARPARPGDRVG